MNLRRFFGDYRTFAFAPDAFHLGIGEIANVTPDTTWQRILHEFYQDPRLVSRATMYSGTRGEEEANQAMAEHVGGLLGRRGTGGATRAALRWRAQCHQWHYPRLRGAARLQYG